jgi:hypothetical protein
VTLRGGSPNGFGATRVEFPVSCRFLSANSRGGGVIDGDEKIANMNVGDRGFSVTIRDGEYGEAVVWAPALPDPEITTAGDTCPSRL